MPMGKVCADLTCGVRRADMKFPASNTAQHAHTPHAVLIAHEASASELQPAGH